MFSATMLLKKQLPIMCNMLPQKQLPIMPIMNPARSLAFSLLSVNKQFEFCAFTCYRMCYNTPFVTKGGEHRLLAKEKMMAIDDQSLPELVKEIRRQLSLSQEDLARELGISFATVNRWENGLVKPSKLARAQFDAFCSTMIKHGKLRF